MPLPSPLRIAADLRRTYNKRIRTKRLKRTLGLDIRDRFYYPLNTKQGQRLYTVVSAVYNVEEYLDDMLSSLLRQTLDFLTHINVVLVNDGSTDRSGEICDEWATKFPANIKVIHKENEGQASARNAGLPYANGEWVTFIDSDDLVDKNYFMEVDQALDEEAADDLPMIVSCNYLKYIEDKNK